MRMAFGIVSLLMTVAIIMYLMVGGGGTGGPGYLKQVSQTNKQLKGQVNQLGGYDENRQVLATESIKYHIERSSGRPKLLVKEVMPGGPMEVRYGLRVGDRVTEIGPLEVGQNVSNFDDATAAFHDAYARGGTITVVRDGKTIALPEPDHVAKIEALKKDVALTNAQQQAAAAAPPPPPAPSDEKSAVQKALDAVRAPRGQ